MGRDRSNERQGKASTEHFTKMIRGTMETPAWKALTPTAQALYPWLKLEWHGPKANNNGKIQLSVRQAADCLGVTHVTSSKALHDLQAKGFIAVTQAACLGLGGTAQSPMYEITELAMPSGGHSGRKLYEQWQPSADFPISKTLTNNPKGTNGKSNSKVKGGANNVHKLHR